MRGVLLALAWVLTGCLAQQAKAGPRIWYVGLGMYDEKWSENDVTDAAAALSTGRASDTTMVPLVLSYGQEHRYEPPDRATVEAATSEIARKAGPSDIVLLYISTHGAPGLLAREADDQPLRPADISEVSEWLAPLGARPTVVILSACFSGSFIPGLRADNRVIFAAARPDRTSFGCQPGAQHTVFGNAMLDALATPSTSLRRLVARVRAEVTARERELRVTQPSEPQLSVGPAVARLYDAPLF